jgi:hypothetical protein
MGLPPLNKLYSIMLTGYALVKQAYARANHDRLSAITSSGVNSFLLLCALTSCIFGPCIGFFDTYYDVKTHCVVTKLFTIGELLYSFVIITVVNNNRLSFPQNV